MDQNPSIPAPLPVFEIIRNALQFAWDKRARMLRALSIPMAVMFILGAIHYIAEIVSETPGYPQSEITRLDISLWLISIPFYVLFAITCHRLVLLRDSGIATYGNLTWSKRETRFFWWGVFIPLAYMLLIILFPIGFGLLIRVFPDFGKSPSDLADSFWFKMFGYLLFLPSTYIIARLSLIFPATAVDRQVDIKWAWNLSRNNSWRLTVVVGILPWVFAFFQGLFARDSATLVEDLIHLMVSFIFLAVEIVALSFSYKHLAEQVAPPASAVLP